MRFTPHTPEDRTAMLKAIGVDDIEELFADVPEAVRYRGPLPLPEGMPEMWLERHVSALAKQNVSLKDWISFLGAGVYDRFIPAAVDAIVRRSEFYTSYTPYQPEVSQGMLQVIYEFQSYITALTGLDVAQASMYDGATALAEAALMAEAETGRKRVLVSRAVDPQFRAVLRTYSGGHGLVIEELPLDVDRTDLEALAAGTDGAAAVVLQQPNFLGTLEDAREAAELTHRAGGLFILAVDPVAAALLPSAGEVGADIAVGEGQSLGLPPSFGGPFLGFMAARRSLVRRLPGRIAGATVDQEGKRGYVLTLQAREQHIRREKATSNVCTNQGLMALQATVFLALLGPEGLRRMAARSLEGAHRLAKRLAEIPGVRIRNAHPYFQEFIVETPIPATVLVQRLKARGILAGLPLATFYPEFGEKALLVAVTEKRTEDDLARFTAEVRAAVTEEGIGR